VGRDARLRQPEDPGKAPPVYAFGLRSPALRIPYVEAAHVELKRASADALSPTIRARLLATGSWRRPRRIRRRKEACHQGLKRRGIERFLQEGVKPGLQHALVGSVIAARCKGYKPHVGVLG
jgi:hypothetical protein